MKSQTAGHLDLLFGLPAACGWPSIEHLTIKLSYLKLSVVVTVLYDSLKQARQHGKQVGDVIHILGVDFVTNPET